jgi:hypothetical protein
MQAGKNRTVFLHTAELTTYQEDKIKTYSYERLYRVDKVKEV